MSEKYEVGQEVKYRVTDKKGNEKWYKGVIFGVRSYDHVVKGKTKAETTYLVDTGRDTRVDEYKYDERDLEVNKRIAKTRKKGEALDTVLERVLKDKDLPENKLVVEKVRQPEQLELHPDNIQPLE